MRRVPERSHGFAIAYANGVCIANNYERDNKCEF
jgi:hypothetical protein